ncbi:MAG: TraB/GumN family protein [Thermoplasmata archaeon]|nr:TraB/GumN family protein [Thermoplasmata archaeon]
MDKEIVLIGVGHVFDIGTKIKNIISQEAPQAIAIELDRRRLQALLNPVKKKGLNIYSLLSLSQAMMAKKFGVMAGNEMLAAIEFAKEKDMPLYYIDMDSYVVINKLWRKIKFKDKLKIILSAFVSLFLSKKKIEKELDKLENNGIIEEMEKYFPELKKILVDERNEYMVRNLLRIIEEYDKIVAVVGEGHINGMEDLLKDYVKVKCIHLKDYLDLNK